MKLKSFVALLQAHLKSREIVLADASTGHALDGLTETSALLEIAELVSDAQSDTWEDTPTVEIRREEMYALAAASVNA